MRGWFLSIIVLFYLATWDVSAQADRSYLQAGVAYVPASGHLTDSASFESSMAYSLGYQWSPSRSLSFGINGLYLPATVTSNSPASVFGMAAVVNYRFFKHGFTPYVGAEAGFHFLSVADSLAERSFMKPNLSYALTANAGLLIPISEKVEADIAGRYTYAGIGGGVALVGGSVGLRYRLR